MGLRFGASSWTVVTVLVVALTCGGLTACGEATDSAGDADDARSPAGDEPVEGSTDWAQLGSDLASTYHARYEKVLSVESAPRLRERWMVSLGAAPNGATLVVGEYLYVATARNLFKLRADTAEVVWEVSPGGSSTPAYVDGVLYMHAGDDSVTARDPETGDAIWTVDRASRFSVASGFSSVVVAGRYVIIGTSSGEEDYATRNAVMRGEVVAYDRDDGKELWRHLIPDEGINGATVWSTPSVDLDSEVVFITTGNNYTERAGSSSDSIIALDLTSGERLWKNQLTEGDVYTTPMTNGNPDYDFGANPILFEASVDGEMTKLVGAGQKSGYFHTLRRDNGELVWSTQVSTGSVLGGVMNNGAYDGSRILVASNTTVTNGVAILMALDPGTGAVLWRHRAFGKVWAPITVANGVAMVIFNTTMLALDAANGEVLRELTLPGTSSSAPVVSNGRIYVGSGLNFETAMPGSTYHAFEVGP